MLGFRVVSFRFVVGWRAQLINQLLDAVVQCDGDFYSAYGVVSEERAAYRQAMTKRRQNVNYQWGAGRENHLANCQRQYQKDIERCRVEYDAFKRLYLERHPGAVVMGMDRFRRFFRQQFRHDPELVIAHLFVTPREAKQSLDFRGQVAAS